jgi:hypothetical protein
VSVVVILLMFLAVIAMVEKADRARLRHPVLAPESRGAEDAGRLQLMLYLNLCCHFFDPAFRFGDSKNRVTVL